MTAFNEVDGIPASGNKWLMTDVLRDQWGFDGFVVTDYTAINEMTEHGMGDLQTVSAMALKARVDLDMIGEGFLTTLQKKGRIALVGPLADNRWNMAGTWSVAVDHTESVTVLEGFRNILGDKAEIHYARGSNIVDDPEMDLRVAPGRKPSFDTVRSPEQLRAEAVAVASRCDVIVAVMGEAAEMSGESASRTELGLPGSQQKLLRALLKTGKTVVLVLFTGRPLTITWEQENIPAILNVWFGGTQGGNAIADVIFGDVNPSGKLPVTFPRNVGQIPIYYNHKNTGRPLPEGEWFRKFRSNYLDVPNDPLYPFGFGLSYSTFTYSNIELTRNQEPGT